MVKGITNEAKNLSDYPKMGQVEELLRDRTQNFRYLVHTNYKIIYWINLDKKRIEIVDVFDCRQNPTKMKQNKPL